MTTQKDKPVILFDSPLAAQPIYTKAWVSARGRIFLSEYEARLDGATHRKCDAPGCERVHEMSRGLCKECREKHDAQKYATYPQREWDEVCPLYSEVTDEWLYDTGQVEDHIREHQEPPLPDDALITPQGLAQWLTDYRIVLTDANYYAEIDPGEYYHDELPDDNKEVHDDIEAAFGVLNECIKAVNKRHVACWRPMEFRPIFSLEPTATEPEVTP